MIDSPRRWREPLSRALVIEEPHPDLDARLSSLGIAVERLSETPDEASLARILREGQHDLLFKRSAVAVTEEVVQASKRLAAVLLCCIGDDSVDKEACAQHGVMVMNDPVSNGRSVAEMVIGEMVTLSRRVFDSVSETAQSRWYKNSTQRFEVRGKRVGVLGLGKIGRQVAQLAEGLGAQILFFDSSPIAQEIGTTLGWSRVESIDELFRAADIVTVHVSATDHHGKSNAGLISRDNLREMGNKEHGSPRVFINLARGFLYDPKDLCQAVQDDRIAYALVDVFPDEPRSGNQIWTNPYADQPRIFATPHIGAATQEAQPRIARYVARTAELFGLHGALRDCVFFPRVELSVDATRGPYRLCVAHLDKRGTKKAVDDAIYRAGANNLQSAHIDSPRFGIAYDLSALDRPLDDQELDQLVATATELTGDPQAIRSLRVIDPGNATE
jgi:D-3-phosphoglycerate dehydrogenase